MQAPIVQLDLSVKEPIQAASMANSSEQKTEAKTSSFEKELEKAMNSNSKQEKAPKVDEEVRQENFAQSLDKKKN